MWEKIEKTILLSSVAAAVLSIVKQNDSAGYISWFSTIMTFLAVFRAPSFNLKLHWRSVFLYTGNITLSILLILFTLKQSDKAHDLITNSALPITSYILLALCIFTAPIHFLFPVPAARSLPGKFKLIGTTSFDIPLVDLDVLNASQSNRSPVTSERKPDTDGPEVNIQF